MTQEILDYLLIKAHFIVLTDEQILENVKDEDILESYCDGIGSILDKEEFFYIDERFIKKLERLVSEKRFNGKHSKETIINFNKMIGAINRYKTLSESDKILIGAKWIDEEAIARDLPFRKFPGYTLNLIYEYIKTDAYYAKLLLNYNSDLEIFDGLDLVATINLLCNRYPEVFKENPIGFCLCEQALEIIKENTKKILFLKMVKKTAKRLEKIDKEFLIENKPSYQKVIKKD